jgi:hypothetical protein
VGAPESRLTAAEEAAFTRAGLGDRQHGI